MKIVVIEDEIRIREGIRTLLYMMGEEYEYAGEAENGELGIELIQKVQPDLVITDIRMPDMDGLEMLRVMKERDIQARAIVLSAYSEFEYARKALQLGVTEYLLKPIAVDEFSKALHCVKEQIEKESLLQPETMGTLEQVMGNLLYGQIKADVSIKSYLFSKYRVNDKNSIIELCVYLGRDFADRADRVQREWQRMLNERNDLKFCIVKAIHEQSVVILLYEHGKLHDVERRIQYWVLQNAKSNKSFRNVGWIVADNLDSLKESFDKVFSCMDWNITLGSGIMINYHKIMQIQTRICVYPIELENTVKTELCLGDMERVEKIVQSFHAYFIQGNVYTPKDIKECYVRFIWAIINIAKEIDMLDYAKLNQQIILDKIMNARTHKELEEITKEVMNKMKMQEASDEEVGHLTVKRVKGIIHEFYQTGITLDEIACKLNVTPEYLSAQFHKVVGETYSSYIKNYRIGKAKELLIGTQLKLYEIAKEVGYSDRKYFSRVFKECTGYLPAEYRKTYK